MDTFSAHIKYNTDGEKIIQTCQEHCNGVAEIARKTLSDIGLGETAYIAGMLHDCGKFTEAFQNYLEDAASGIQVKRGSVNHTFAGVKYILEKYHDINEDATLVLTSEIIAYTIGAHHGLFDCVNEDHSSGFSHRLDKHGISYEEAISNFQRFYKTESDVQNCFRDAVGEVRKVLETIQNALPDQEDENSEDKCQEMFFGVGLLARLVLSSVVNGDREDTAAFCSGNRRYENDATGEMWRKTLRGVEKRLSLIKSKTDISLARAQLSEMCKESAMKEPGIYRLNMPTGSGKTLSSLRYALSHSERWGKKRIVFVTPLLSILDQNATVIREYVGNDEIVLEHHSNIVRPKEGTEEYDKWEYYTENWHSPIIITTMVQFLNTLFSGRMGAVRRMQALCNSVIVIDEVQTVPVKMLSLFNSSINFLQSICKCTIVLSSATQPCFENARYPLRNIKGELVHCSNEIEQLFRRTKIIRTENQTQKEVVSLIEKTISECNSLLVVCNKKDEARYLYTEIESSDCDVFHLSAAMCIRHRKDVLEKIRLALDNISKTHRKVVCISTQIIEAGVDISFEKAIRFAAGMDSVIQTAGRCNRNGDSHEPGEVQIFPCFGENLNRLDEIKKGKMVTEKLLEEFRKDERKFMGSLDSRDAISYYYSHYYASFPKNYQEYTIRNKDTLYNLLAQNSNYVGIQKEANAYYLKQAFMQAGKEFKVFDADCIDVIVPYRKGLDLINDLNSENAMWNDEVVIRALEEAKQYTVPLYSYQVRKLTEAGALYELHDGRTIVLQPQFYNEQMGVMEENESNGYLEVS